MDASDFVTAAIGAGDPKMWHAHLAVYLGDHRAGALQLLETLEALGIDG